MYKLLKITKKLRNLFYKRNGRGWKLMKEWKGLTLARNMEKASHWRMWTQGTTMSNCGGRSMLEVSSTVFNKK